MVLLVFAPICTPLNCNGVTQANGSEDLLQMAAEIEGHVDNIAPCIYGGMQVCLAAFG